MNIFAQTAEEIASRDLWVKVINAMGLAGHPNYGWYYGESRTVFEDFLRCRADAVQAGVPRAQTFMLEYLELRMKG